MRNLVLITLALAACAPPPEVAGTEPTITIAFPEIDGQEVQQECLPNPAYNCDPDATNTVDPYRALIQLTVVVDIDNLSLTDPYAADAVLVDGEGHWHAHIENESITSSFTRAADVIAEVEPGLRTLDANLRDTEHEMLGPRDAIEFTVTAVGTDCSVLPEDYCE